MENKANMTKEKGARSTVFIQEFGPATVLREQSAKSGVG
jgi:hypothetical protein